MKTRTPIIYLLNILILVFFVIIIPKDLKIKTRTYIFSKQVEISSLKEYNRKNFLDKYGFKHRKLEYYHSTGNNEILKKNMCLSKDFTDSIMILVNSLGKSVGEGCGSNSDDIIANHLSVSQGQGCCSDYSQVFIALCIANNITVREVSNLEHTFDEVYYEKYNKWIFVDPQFKLIALNEESIPLNSFEILQSYKNLRKINFVFIGNNKDYLFNRNVSRFIKSSNIPNWTPEAFSALMLTNGNNVFQENKYNKQFRIFPKELRQFFLLSFGIKPIYLLYDPENKLTLKHKTPVVKMFVLCLLLFGLINFVIYRFIKK